MLSSSTQASSSQSLPCDSGRRRRSSSSRSINNNGRRRASERYCSGDGHEFYDDYGVIRNSQEGMIIDETEQDEEDSINDELDFTQMIARHEELKILQDSFAQVVETGISSICLVEGQSGNGKSTLVHQFAKELTQQHLSIATDNDKDDDRNDDHADKVPGITSSRSKPQEKCLILFGKFEEFNCDPLSAIVKAYSDGLKKIHNDPPAAKKLKDDISNNDGLLGKQGAAQLATIVPALLCFTTDVFTLDSHTEEESSVSESNNFSSSRRNMKQQSSSTIRLSDQDSERLVVAVESSTNSLGEEDNGEIVAAVTENEYSWNRMKYLFKALSLIMGSQQRPIIVFIDDLQWSDGMSLELLETLLLDKDLKYFFLIGAYRSDEISTSKGESLADVAEYWNSLERANKTVTKIVLENFSMEQLCDFLKGALSLNGEDIEEEENARVRELAAALHPRTLGNIFFTRQVLQELYTSGNLSFCRMSFRWEWNLEGIQFSDNVLDAVTNRIQNNTTKLLRKLLTIAAYMRSTFDVDSLKAMVDLEGIYMLSKNEIVSELDEAVVAGFLTKSPGSSKYSFAHDRIQQAAYNLVPEGNERDKFRFAVGSHLYSISRNKKFSVGKEWMIYSAADHFNATTRLSKNPLFLAIVNLQAGKKCMSIAAFKNASTYFSYGLKSLHNVDNVWEEHYRTALVFYECYIEAELIQGHLDTGKDLARILVEKVHDVNDSLRTQLALARAMGRKKGHRASFDLSRSALRSMNMYASTSFGFHSNLIKDMFYVKRYFRNHSDEDILNLPKCSDQRFDIAIELYENNMYHGWCCGKGIHWLASCLKALRTTFEFGLSPHSGVAIMGYFMYCSNVGDLDGAHRFASLGLRILARCDDQTPFCLQLLAKSAFLDCWSTNIAEVLDQFDEAYKSGIQLGDFESAMRCLNDKLEHQYSSGHPLALLDIQYADLVEKEDMYCTHSLKQQTIQQWFTTRVLRGKAIQPPLDFGSFLDFDKDLQSDDSDPYPLLYAFRNRLQIAVYWSNYDFAARLLEKEVTFEEQSHNANAVRLFFLAIAHGTLYRMTGRLKHQRRARGAVAELKAFCCWGMNSWHRVVIASAHLKGCDAARKKRNKAGEFELVLKKYDEGRELAASRQLWQDVGLAAQLTAEFLIHVDKKGMSRTNNYLTVAKDSYRDWGAIALVEHLEQQYNLSPSRSPLSENIAEAAMSSRDAFSSALKSSEATAFFSVVSSSR